MRASSMLVSASSILDSVLEDGLEREVLAVVHRGGEGDELDGLAGVEQDRGELAPSGFGHPGSELAEGGDQAVAVGSASSPSTP